jgi:hypothetical protein
MWWLQRHIYINWLLCSSCQTVLPLLKYATVVCLGTCSCCRCPLQVRTLNLGQKKAHLIEIQVDSHIQVAV